MSQTWCTSGWLITSPVFTHCLTLVPKLRGSSPHAPWLLDGKRWAVQACTRVWPEQGAQTTSNVALSYFLARAPLFCTRCKGRLNPSPQIWALFCVIASFPFSPQMHFSLMLCGTVSLRQKWRTCRGEMWSGKSLCTLQFSALWLINYCVFSVLWHAVQFVRGAVMIGCPELIIKTPLFGFLSLLGKS